MASKAAIKVKIVSTKAKIDDLKAKLVELKGALAEATEKEKAKKAAAKAKRK